MIIECVGMWNVAFICYVAWTCWTWLFPWKVIRRDPIELTQKLTWPNIWRARRLNEVSDCSFFVHLTGFVGFCWVLDAFLTARFFFAASLMTMTMAGISFFSLSFHRTKQTFSLVSRVLCDQVQSLVASKELVKASGKHATKMGHLPFVIRRSAINDHFQKLIMLIHQRRTYNQTFVALAKCQMIRG